jgi:hypothetical protein
MHTPGPERNALSYPRLTLTISVNFHRSSCLAVTLTEEACLLFKYISGEKVRIFASRLTREGKLSPLMHL